MNREEVKSKIIALMWYKQLLIDLKRRQGDDHPSKYWLFRSLSQVQRTIENDTPTLGKGIAE